MPFPFLLLLLLHLPNPLKLADLFRRWLLGCNSWLDYYLRVIIFNATVTLLRPAAMFADDLHWVCTNLDNDGLVIASTLPVPLSDRVVGRGFIEP